MQLGDLNVLSELCNFVWPQALQGGPKTLQVKWTCGPEVQLVIPAQNIWKFFPVGVVELLFQKYLLGIDQLQPRVSDPFMSQYCAQTEWPCSEILEYWRKMFHGFVA